MSPPPFSVMGIVNVTPDSFSDGGRYLDPDRAIAHGLELDRQGAAYLDIGGESTRPGASPVDAEEELRRVLPVVEGLRDAELGARISVDTSKAEVAAAVLTSGAQMINDVTALRHGPGIAELVAAHDAELCLMHMQGEPGTMQEAPHYDDVVDEVARYLEERLAFAVHHGVPEARIVLDPGIGFGKSTAHNLALLTGLEAIVALGRPVLVGTSRKGFLGRLTGGRDVEGRLPGTIATNVIALQHGARIFRAHDVAPILDALRITAATLP